MAIRIVPYEPALVPAAREFNARLRAHPSPAPFFLPELAADPPSPSASIRVSHHLALDDSGACRGGILTQEHPAWLNGAVQTVINIQSPLSESIIDTQYAMVGPQLIRSVLKRNPLVFVIGMGADVSNPLPRLLSVMGWKVRHMPFMFSLLRPSVCARELAPFQRTPLRRAAATVAAASGLAALGAGILQRGVSSSGRWPETTVPPPGSRQIWSRFTESCRFAVVRDEITLPEWYPAHPQSSHLYHHEHDGWFSLLLSPMRGHHHFGNATVATLVDCVAPAHLLPDAVATAIRQAKQAGADLLVANFTFGPLLEACRAAGMLTGPSNCLLATSKALSEGMRDEDIYVSRRDGDGLINLIANTSERSTRLAGD